MKKPIVIVLVISILCIGAVGAFILWKQKSASKSPETIATPTNAAQELALWEDQAGFSFKYPKTLSFDKHDEDEKNYAHIEFKSATHSGRLIIWAKDTSYTDVTTWVTKDKTLTDVVTIATTLGGQPAKKLVISTPTKKYVTGAILDQILFTIEAEPIEGDSYWIDISNTIVSSFTFIPLDSSSIEDSSGDAESYVDEEEVVE